MKVVLQRVANARVEVERQAVGEIQTGLLLLVGLAKEDSEATLTWMAKKIVGLRIFSDADGKMNLSVQDVQGACLAVSQFTLLGDCRKGTRPGFSQAAPPEVAKPLFERFVEILRGQGVPVETGVFQAEMQVTLTNDGPVTFTLEKT